MDKLCIDGNDWHRLLQVLGYNDCHVSFACPIVNTVAEAISSTIAFHLQYVDEDVLSTWISLKRLIPDIPIANSTWPLRR